MAGSKNQFLEQALLNHVLGNTAYSTPATVFIALWTVTPGNAGSGGTEVTGGSYARVSVTNNTTNWPNATGGGPATKHNGADFTFPTATANWGTVVTFSIMDASSSGNYLYYGDLTVSKTISTGDTAKFASGDITITED